MGYFTNYKSVLTPKVVQMEVFGDIALPDWILGVSLDGIPIAKNTFKPTLESQEIIDLTPEQEAQEVVEEPSPVQEPVYSNNRVEQAVSFFKNKLQNYSKEMKLGKSDKWVSDSAAAIVGNLMWESGDPTLNVTTNFGDNGTAFGMALWRNERQINLKRFANKRAKPHSDFKTQLEFVWHELLTSHKRALNGLLASTNRREATKIFMNLYEVPNLKLARFNERFKFANSLT